MDDRTLEELEGDVWGEPVYDSGLVTTCYRLRKKPLGEFRTEDLRIMIGQQISLPILLPRAIGVLRREPLAEGHFYVSLCSGTQPFGKSQSLLRQLEALQSE